MIAPDPSGSGVADAVRGALRGRPRSQVAWIKAHGTGTRPGDAAEYRGLGTVFGERISKMPLTSLKPAIGHCLGASGAVEAVAVVLAMERRVIPGTLYSEQPDPELSLCNLAVRQAACDPGTVLLLSESFGGRCAALAVGPGGG